MRFETVSGQWVEMRDISQLTAGDKLAMRAAVRLPVGGNADSPNTVVSLGDMDFQTYVVAARVINAWSYPFLVPKDDPSLDGAGFKTYEQSLMMMPIDDWNELEGVLGPYQAKLEQDPKGTRTTSTTSRRTSRAKDTASPAALTN